MVLHIRQGRGLFIVLTLLFISLSFVANSVATEGKVDLNRASVEELQTLKGIGKTLAQRIVDYREAHGPFQHIDEIKKTKGIGAETFNKIKDTITVSLENREMTGR